MACCGRKNEELRIAAEALAADVEGTALYEQWQQMRQEPQTTVDEWLAWQQDVERTPAADRYFSLLQNQEQGVSTGERGCDCGAHGS